MENIKIGDRVRLLCCPFGEPGVVASIGRKIGVDWPDMPEIGRTHHAPEKLKTARHFNSI
jgi:hypothetical protein